MKLTALTICLDGEPYIERHLPEFEKMKHEWQWCVVHGASQNGGSTRWCRKQEPRLSHDGTTEYLATIKHHPNVELWESKSWPSKDAMVNAPLPFIREPCVLMQIDADEIWTAEQLDGVVQMFEQLPHIMRAYFWCRYYVGPDIIAITENGWSNRSSEWLRAWRFSRFMRFNSHEPPVLAWNQGPMLGRDFTRSRGLVFEHFAYATEAHVRYKSEFYRYGQRAIDGWKALQENTNFPCLLKDYFPWADGNVVADKI